MTNANTKKILLLIWLIASQLFFIASLAVWVIMWGFSGEVVSVFFYFVFGYMVCIIVCAMLSWIGFAKGIYRRSLLWNLLPYAWFIILIILFLTL